MMVRDDDDVFVGVFGEFEGVARRRRRVDERVEVRGARGVMGFDCGCGGECVVGGVGWVVCGFGV